MVAFSNPEHCSEGITVPSSPPSNWTSGPKQTELRTFGLVVALQPINCPG